VSEQTEVLLRVEWHPRIEELVGGNARWHDQNLTAVARSFGDPVHAEIASGAGNILDHGGHLPQRTRSVRDHAPDDILGPPAGKPTMNLTVNPAG
jgi:hypothetical protein